MKLKLTSSNSGKSASGKKHPYLAARIIGFVCVIVACILAVSGVIGYSYATRSSRFAQEYAAKLSSEASRHADILSGVVTG